MPMQTTVTSKAAAVATQVPALAAVIVEKTATDLVTVAQTSMDSSGGGAVYKRGNKTHQASLPGNPPAVDDGTLRAAVAARPLGQLEWEVTVGAAHGVYQEFGTSRIAPRPFLYPAAQQVWPSMVAAFEQIAGALGA